MNKIFYALFFVFAFCSCKEEKNEDVVQQPNKDGSIETVLSVTHIDSFDVLTTTHKVWVKGNLSKTIVTSDTLNTLGTTQVETKDSNGQPHQEQVRKDYEFYITVK